MTTLKQILCAIINFGHPYDRKDLAWFRVTKWHTLTEIVPVYLKCSCGKVWERKDDSCYQDADDFLLYLKNPTEWKEGE